MGMPGPMELGMILVVVMLIFGTSRLRSVGKDLGGAIKDFKSGLSGDDDNDSQKPPATSSTETEEKPAE